MSYVGGAEWWGQGLNRPDKIFKEDVLSLRGFNMKYNLLSFFMNYSEEDNPDPAPSGEYYNNGNTPKDLVIQILESMECTDYHKVYNTTDQKNIYYVYSKLKFSIKKGIFGKNEETRHLIEYISFLMMQFRGYKIDRSMRVHEEQIRKHWDYLIKTLVDTDNLLFLGELEQEERSKQITEEQNIISDLRLTLDTINYGAVFDDDLYADVLKIKKIVTEIQQYEYKYFEVDIAYLVEKLGTLTRTALSVQHNIKNREEGCPKEIIENWDSVVSKIEKIVKYLLESE